MVPASVPSSPSGGRQLSGRGPQRGLSDQDDGELCESLAAVQISPGMLTQGNFRTARGYFVGAFEPSTDEKMANDHIPEH